MYHNSVELLEMCKTENKRMWEVALDIEIATSGADKESVLAHFEERLDVMISSATKALEKNMSTMGGLIDGVAKKQYDHSKAQNLSGNYINYAMALAYSASEVNASMGKICASPTAGSCGILPAVLHSMMQCKGVSRQRALEGLIVASVVGYFFMHNATVAGADGGCQAECGVAAAMAAAAACYMSGADDQTCFNAAGFAIINIMGLVCDPVAGLVQLPCAQRNASGAVNALISADMAMAGQTAHIPFDQVVDAMFKVGKMLPPQLRETAKGGIATTPAGKAIYKEIFGK